MPEHCAFGDGGTGDGLESPRWSDPQLTLYRFLTKISVCQTPLEVITRR